MIPLLLFALSIWTTVVAALADEVEDAYAGRNQTPAHPVVRVIILVQAPFTIGYGLATAPRLTVSYFKDLGRILWRGHRDV